MEIMEPSFQRRTDHIYFFLYFKKKKEKENQATTIRFAFESLKTLLVMFIILKQ